MGAHITFLLLSNKLPQMLRFKIATIYYLGLSIGQKSWGGGGRLSWVLCLGKHVLMSQIICFQETLKIILKTQIIMELEHQILYDSISR